MTAASTSRTASRTESYSSTPGRSSGRDTGSQARTSAPSADVGADELTDVRDLVDEADAGGEKGVGRELHELRRWHVRAHHLGLDAAVQLDDPVRVLVLEGADDDPVWMHEVLDGAALGE